MRRLRDRVNPAPGDDPDPEAAVRAARRALYAVRSLREETYRIARMAGRERVANHFGDATVDALRSRRER